MRFTPTTQLPLSAVTTLARLKELYACGPCMALDSPQRELLDAFHALYPSEKLRVVNGALNAGRVYVTGADLLAVTQPAVDEEPAHAVEQ